MKGIIIAMLLLSLLLPVSIIGATTLFDYSVIETASGIKHYLFFNNGDVYFRGSIDGDYQWPAGTTPQALGNFWGSIAPRSDLLAYRVSIWGDVHHFILCINGDVYRNISGSAGAQPFQGDAFYLGNIWGNLPVAVDKSTWGGVKAQFKK
jgi:hypothetical protein